MHRHAMPVALVLVMLLAALPASASPPALAVSVAGEPVVVFSRSRDRCGRFDTPDAPARAVRTAAGEVVLFAAHFDNRALRGPSLLDLRPDCAVTFEGAEDPDPARFSDRSWIASLWTEDGTTIHAIVHNEHQGHRHDGQCPTRRYRDCWFNALTAAVSVDAARRFRPAGPPPSLVASLPYTAEAMRGRPAGYHNPTGIVAHQGALHMLAFASARGAQLHGNCLLRTTDIADPSAWRAWDGEGFVIRFANPYADGDAASADPSRHVCAPVGAGGLQWPVMGLVRHAPSGLFVAVMLGAPHRPDHAEPLPGIYIATSADLVSWSRPALVMPAVGHARWRCGEDRPVAYPALLDPDSEDRSFSTVGDRAQLFMTRFNVPACRIDGDRDLIRIPVAIARRGAASP